MKDYIKSEVEDAFDHKNLNIEVHEFADTIPTAENIVVVIYNKLKKILTSEQFVINGDLIGYEGNGRPYEFPNGVVITKNYLSINSLRLIL